MGCLKRAIYYLVRKKKKTIILFLIFLISLLTIMTTFQVMLAAGETQSSIQQKAKSKIILSQKAADIPITEEMIIKIEQNENIAKNNCYIKINAMPIDFGNVDSGIEEEGIDYTGIALHGYDDMMEDGPFAEQLYRIVEGEAADSAGEGVVNIVLAQVNQWALGNVISFEVEGSTFSIKIVGIFKSVDGEGVQGLGISSIYRIENQIYIHHDQIKKMQIAAQYEEVAFYLKNPDKLENTKEVIEDYASDDFEVSEYNAIYKNMEASLEQVNKLMTFILVFTIVIACILLILLFYLWIYNRMREIAILRSLGHSRKEIYIQHFFEIISIFIIAIVIGRICAGMIANQIINKLIISNSVIGEISFHKDILIYDIFTFLGGMIFISIIIFVITMPILNEKPQIILARSKR